MFVKELPDIEILFSNSSLKGFNDILNTHHKSLLGVLLSDLWADNGQKVLSWNVVFISLIEMSKNVHNLGSSDLFIKRFH